MTLTGCCCMSLRTAGLVLGWLGLAISAITISSTMNHLSRYDPEDDEYESPSKAETIQTLRCDIIFLSISVLNVLITGLLINGITSNKHRFLLPWLIVKGLGLLVIIPLGFLILAGSTLTAEPIQIVASLLLLLIIGFCCLCWMAVYSLYKEIKASTGKQLTFFESNAINSGTIPYQLFEKY
ncbi:uncharacterized protein LOC129952433 [Eupeodes corollae]|uniref:uncharacterized protein LOC129952433 n=1 Tax=Eupeodes corollae TaxID=290404 RepID=UPI002493B6B0|nr:uncharacterized protein LOC129952433 [Eupeodes corollae]